MVRSVEAREYVEIFNRLRIFPLCESVAPPETEYILVVLSQERQCDKNGQKREYYPFFEHSQILIKFVRFCGINGIPQI